MMKIMHIIPGLPPCGAEKVVLNYLQEFGKDSNYEVMAVVLSNNQHRIYERIAEDEGLNIMYLNQNIDDNRPKSRIKQIIQIREAFKAVKPDVIHIHLSILWMICLASIGIGVKKMFHTLHSDPQKTSYGLHVYVDRFCYKLFNVRTLALNQEMKEKADLLFHLDNTLVLRNGIDIESYSNQPRIELRQDFGIPVDCFVLGHVGRFNKVKNHTKIIDVFKEIKKSKPLSKLLLVGDGEEMGRIREKVNSYSLSDDVIFTGSRNDVPQMMAMMDCFIFPSLYEGLGIVLLEAQAAGLKCVVADTVPQETTVTDKVFRLPLDCDSEIWASTALGRNDLKPAPINQSIEAYDISNVIATLKEYYECE